MEKADYDEKYKRRATKEWLKSIHISGITIPSFVNAERILNISDACEKRVPSKSSTSRTSSSRTSHTFTPTAAASETGERSQTSGKRPERSRNRSPSPKKRSKRSHSRSSSRESEVRHKRRRKHFSDDEEIVEANTSYQNQILALQYGYRERYNRDAYSLQPDSSIKQRLKQANEIGAKRAASEKRPDKCQVIEVQTCRGHFPDGDECVHTDTASNRNFSSHFKTHHPQYSQADFRQGLYTTRGWINKEALNYLRSEASEQRLRHQRALAGNPKAASRLMESSAPKYKPKMLPDGKIAVVDEPKASDTREEATSETESDYERQKQRERERKRRKYWTCLTHA